MNKVFIVAEISANHNQDYEQAEKLVRIAKEVGADAVKLQTYTPDTLTINCDRPEFIIKGGTPWDGKTLYELYGEAYMPWEWQPRLKKVADEIGIELFSTPYDKTAVDFLENMGVQRYKIASFELVDLELIGYVASKGKPIIMSTGMATLPEIKEAVSVAEEYGTTDITLLKCTSAYPAKPEEMNLLTVQHLAMQFLLLPGWCWLSVGISDHTLGIIAPIVATSLGATMIEKHLTISKSLDSSFSLTPNEFEVMVVGIRSAEKMLGEGIIGATDREVGSKVFRRSLFVVEDIKKGEEFTEQNVRSIRPGDGLLPKHLSTVLGNKSRQNIERGTPLQWEMLSIAD
ncbi:hypothetical protein LCGC14_2171190 [marine sediment metagenome]|uniref:AFP-like domain-containing protein n=1 Tax=marine sediment metagenome TaxID=412755 RepID=A0A0F9DPV7_9ZZZZ